MTLQRIISGAQTGVDRGALDAALDAGFACGGWCPAGRSAEDGVIPEKYPVTPLPHRGYRARTRKNVEDGDGTVILAPGELTGGTRLTQEFCRQLKKPHLVIDASGMTEVEAARAVAQFIAEHGIAVLNVAAPRSSGWGQGEAYARTVVVGEVLKSCASG